MGLSAAPQTVNDSAQQWVVRRLLRERPLASLLILLVFATAVIVWHTGRQNPALVEAQAPESAVILSANLSEFRTISTSEVE